jgi:threonine/homoserine/homoserine lactone efflux protein
MPNLLSFTFAVLLVLAMPGPTNTLLATAAAMSGLRNCLILMPAEIAGYAVSIATLLAIVRPIADPSAAAGTVLRILCACYLLYMAWHLWNAHAQPHAAASIRFRHVFTTTLLNPKGVVFAFLIFPQPGAPLAQYFQSAGLFAGICALVCAGWLTLGAMVGRQTGSFMTPRTFRRAAAIALSSFAFLILFLIGSPNVSKACPKYPGIPPTAGCVDTGLAVSSSANVK